MRIAHAFASIALLGWVAAIAPAHAQGAAPEPVLYTLTSPPGAFEWGCFEPCMCPITIRSPLTGRFVLRRSHDDLLYTYYDVLGVHWEVSDSQPVIITGCGTYRRGGEVAMMEQLTLDLSFDGGPPQRFDSGLRPPAAAFPEIDTRVSLHGEFCLDSMLAVGAKPLDVAGVTGGSSRTLSLAVAPNPFTGSAEIAFALPRDGRVELDVYDITGRRIGALAHHEWLASGTHTREWDGRLESGRAVPPGLYVVRLATAWGQVRRTLVKVR